jgi:sirohydrochlorin cobaltochelatase
MSAQSPSAGKSGIILFAHGSRDPLWHKPMDAVALRVKALSPNLQVLCAYLEHSTPTLNRAVQTLVDAQVTCIQVLPVLIGVGKHAREDLPALVDAMREQHPQIRIDLQKAVGEHPQMIQLLADIALSSFNP